MFKSVYLYSSELFCMFPSDQKLKLRRLKFHGITCSLTVPPVVQRKAELHPISPTRRTSLLYIISLWLG